MSTALDSLAHRLKQAKVISLVIHQRPDGDAIGSALALYYAYRSEKKINLVCTTAIPQIFHPLMGESEVSSNLPELSQLIVLLDCSQIHRTGISEKEISRLGNQGCVVIDHHSHPNVQRLACAALYDPAASSTAEIVYKLLIHLRIPITPLIADSLLLGIYTDTGGFRHANTSSVTLSIASKLISCGGNLEYIGNTFGHKRTLAKTKLWGLAFSQATIHRAGLAVVKITGDVIEKCGAKPEDINGVANHLALLKEARAAIVLVETSDGWKATLRTRHPHIDLRQLSRFFGGKGTQKASGFLATKELFSGRIS